MGAFTAKVRQEERSVSWLDTLVRVEQGKGSAEVAGLHDPAPANTSATPWPEHAESGPSELYVATDLESWETNRPEPDQDEICERCGYRRLDPPYYAWLRSMMVRARQAHARAQLPDAEYELLRTRFNAIHAWALARLGEDTLRAVVAEGVSGEYRPPTIWMPEDETQPASTPEHIYPADGDWPFTESVSPEVVAQVDAIRDQALPLGWSEAGLYQNRGNLQFPAGGEYGLVCFLHFGDQIGEISTQSIEIIRPSGNRLRHYNREAPQPWVRRAGRATSPEARLWLQS